jgi:hypothetical protein
MDIHVNITVRSVQADHGDREPAFFHKAVVRLLDGERKAPALYPAPVDAYRDVVPISSGNRWSRSESFNTEATLAGP